MALSDVEKAKRWRERHPEESLDAVRRSHRKHHESEYIKSLEWRKNNPEKCKKHQWKRSFTKMGITPEIYGEKLSRQNGVCAICGKTNTGGKRLFIDHDHKSGAVRGLLCTHCNTGIGMFGDDREILAAAISYLIEWEVV